MLRWTFGFNSGLVRFGLVLILWYIVVLVLSPLTRGSVLRRAYCSADMQVHWGSWRTRDGDAGVLSGFRLAFTLPLPGGSNFRE